MSSVQVQCQMVSTPNESNIMPITLHNSSSVNDNVGTSLKPDATESAFQKFLGGHHRPWRRFFARILDSIIMGCIVTYLFTFLVSILFDIAPRREGRLTVLAWGYLCLLLYMPVEAFLISRFRTTPSKWAFGISVQNANGGNLSFGSAMKRVLLVAIIGEGCSVPVVTLVARLIAYNRLCKTGQTVWDDSVQSCVIIQKRGVSQWLACLLLLAFFWILMYWFQLMGVPTSIDMWFGV